MGNEIPNTLRARFMKYIFLAIVIFFVGILIAFTGLAADSIIKSILPTTVVALALLGMAFWFKYSIKKHGFATYVGICKDVKGITFGRKKKILSYLIETDDGYIEIMAIKLNAEIPEGAKVQIYCPKNVLVYDKNGVRSLSSVYGYEITPN